MRCHCLLNTDISLYLYLNLYWISHHMQGERTTLSLAERAEASGVKEMAGSQMLVSRPSPFAFYKCWTFQVHGHRCELKNNICQDLPRQNSEPSTRAELSLVTGLFGFWLEIKLSVCWASALHSACIPLGNLFWEKHSVTVLAGLELILEPARSWMYNHPASASQEARSADLCL